MKTSILYIRRFLVLISLLAHQVFEEFNFLDIDSTIELRIDFKMKYAYLCRFWTQNFGYGKISKLTKSSINSFETKLLTIFSHMYQGCYNFKR